MIVDKTFVHQTSVILISQPKHTKAAIATQHLSVASQLKGCVGIKLHWSSPGPIATITGGNFYTKTASLENCSGFVFGIHELLK